MKKVKKLGKRALVIRRSNLPGSLVNVKDNFEIVKGLESAIKNKLSISFSESAVNEIIDKVHLIEEYTLELGIDLTRQNYDHQMKNSLWEARTERMNEV